MKCQDKEYTKAKCKNLEPGGTTIIHREDIETDQL